MGSGSGGGAVGPREIERGRVEGEVPDLVAWGSLGHMAGVFGFMMMPFYPAQVATMWGVATMGVGCSILETVRGSGPAAQMARSSA